VVRRPLQLHFGRVQVDDRAFVAISCLDSSVAPAVASCLLPSGRAMVMPSTHVKLGLEPGEIVLRGGFLKTPAVLGGTVTVLNKPFVYLWRTAGTLQDFLSPAAAFKRPLKNCAVFDRLAALRNAEFQKIKAALEREGEAAGDSQQSGKSEAWHDDLDLDDGPASSPDPKRPRKRGQKSKTEAALMPKTVQVVYERPGKSPWEPILLLEPARRAAAMEATAENFQILFDLVNYGLPADKAASGASSPSRAQVADEGRGPKARLLADGSREYFIRGRWVRKTRMEEASTGVADKRRFRTLIRRPSDEGPRIRKAPKRAPKAAAAATPPRAPDNLDLDL